MRHLLLTPLLLFALGAFVGCHKPAVREKPLPDPLLTSKKPIEGRSIFQETSDPREELPPPPPAPGKVPGTVVRLPG